MVKGSIGHAFTVCILTENQNQSNFYPFILYEISVLIESHFGHLCYFLTDVPPQPNSPSDNVFDIDLTISDPNKLFSPKKKSTHCCFLILPFPIHLNLNSH